VKLRTLQVDLFQTHHKGETMGERRSKCKCGKIMVWNDGYNRDSNDKVNTVKLNMLLKVMTLLFFGLKKKSKKNVKNHIKLD